MGFINRKAARLITSYEDISQEGDEWVIHIHTAVISGTHRYKVGVEVEESMMDGRKIRVNRILESDMSLRYGQTNLSQGSLF